jgi:prepilin-type N-terminal cleavage/methylation domain-containing protein|tara:strand:+ start:9531 stop:10034 length:504 start_codon:yes stop_codon:yes gene_type:complete
MNGHFLLRRQTGFTIVELLIVVVVIGILAAIVIVAYNGITNQTHDTTVKNDLANIAKKLEIYRVQSSSGQYPGNATELNTMEVIVAKGSYAIRNNLYYCRSNDAVHYAVGAVSKGGGGYYLVNGTVTDAVGGVGNNATCDQVDPAPESAQAVGYDETGGSGWWAWVE